MLKNFKIAFVCNSKSPLPIIDYGGVQQPVTDLTLNLVNEGHKLTVFAALDSKIAEDERIKLVGFYNALRYMDLTYEEMMEYNRDHLQKSLDVLVAEESREPYDVIGVHTDDRDFIRNLIKQVGNKKVVYFLYNMPSKEKIELINELGIRAVAMCYTHRMGYIETAEKNNLPVPKIDVIVSGVDVDSYPFSPFSLSKSIEIPKLDILKKLKSEGRDYLLSIGMIGEHKGQKTAINIAKKAGLPIVLAGASSGKLGQQYFEEVISIVDNENVFYFGPANQEEKRELYKHALATVFSSGYEAGWWREAFGLVQVESMACGTPVIAYNKYSSKELVEPGITGYLFDTVDQAVSYVREASGLDRNAVRESAHGRFNSKRIAQEFISYLNAGGKD